MANILMYSESLLSVLFAYLIRKMYIDTENINPMENNYVRFRFKNHSRN